MTIYDVAILGAGASGSMCAITCARNNKTVALIDSDSSVSKKILKTGNGRCNLTNTNLSSEFYNINIEKYLKRFNYMDTIKFFNSIGLLTCSDEEGRVYPITRMAKTVVDTINNEIKRLNIKTFCNTIVKEIEGCEKYKIICNNQTIVARNIVFACGGNSLKNIQNNYNIITNSFMPSLVSLKMVNTKKLTGIRLSDVKVTLKYEIMSASHRIMTKSEVGEIIFKDDGIGGIVIFNLSAILARNKNYNSNISIDIFPNIKLDELIYNLEKFKLVGGNILSGILPIAIAQEIFLRCGINYNKINSDLTRLEIMKLAKCIKDFDFSVQGVYDNNQVFSGGVELQSLTNNLESFENHGLYFCGEIVDVDGVCGGYNLQWAWTSGHIVGDSI